MKKTALLVVDMFNTYDHPDADTLVRNVEPVVPVIGDLVKRAHGEDVPVIYVNDNYGEWDSSHEKLIEEARNGRRPDLVEPLSPPEGALFVIKARHTIFFQTPLEYLLEHDLGIERVVLTGQVTEQCILYSTLDAYVREFEVVVPEDAVAHIYEDLAKASLKMMRVNMSAETPPAQECRLT